MRQSDSPARCPACGGRSRIAWSIKIPAGQQRAGQQRYRRCRRCSESWVTVEVTIGDHRATVGAVDDLREKLEQAELDLQREREARMADIRASVRTVGERAAEDSSARLFVEYMMARAEFLRASMGGEDRDRLKVVG